MVPAVLTKRFSKQKKKWGWVEKVSGKKNGSQQKTKDIAGGQNEIKSNFMSVESLQLRWIEIAKNPMTGCLQLQSLSPMEKTEKKLDII